MPSFPIKKFRKRGLTNNLSTNIPYKLNEVKERC